MSILFAASDPGGARAIIPVINFCNERNDEPIVLNHGYLTKEVCDSIKRVNIDELIQYRNFKNNNSKYNFSVLCFGTSIKDKIPLEIASNAKKCGIPTICVLDNWMNYKHRLHIDGDNYHLPDIYAVMDDTAKIKSIQDNIPENIIKVTGHPAFSYLNNDKNNFNYFNRETKEIIFISEPVELDSFNENNRNLDRGYTEKNVLSLMKKKIRMISDKIRISILPHPRDDHGRLESLVNELMRGLDVTIIRNENHTKSIDEYDGVIGITSIILYESWLKDIPTISFQPGLLRDDLNIFENRKGIYSITSYNDIDTSFDDWVDDVFNQKKRIVRDEISIHKNSILSIYSNIKKLSRARKL